MRKTDELSALEARRIAILAQRFSARRPERITAATIRQLIVHLGVVQIDSVNVLVRSHFLPIFSRLGVYDRALLENIDYRKRRLFEYWAHEASLVPIELYPLLRWRMERARRGVGMWAGVAQAERNLRPLVATIRGTLTTEGAMAASDFKEPRTGKSWWGWTNTKRALEYLFWCGEISVRTRRATFERVYDLTERVLPAGILHHKPPDEAAAQRQLIVIAARSFGIATESDLRDYFRIDATDARARVRELIDSNELVPVFVRGWKQAAYLHPSAPTSRKLERSALVSPFDSLVWNRERIARVFNFHYRIEIYTPAHKRIHGYYVLPYLLGDQLVARVDLKADRRVRRLLVRAWHFEDHVKQSAVIPRLRRDLESLARWLELETVSYP